MKILLLAEAANPEWVSVPLVGWSLAKAISEIEDTHIVTQIRNSAAFERAGLVRDVDFTAIDTEALLSPVWQFSKFLRGGTSAGWTIQTALASIMYPYFEHLVWKRFGESIRAGHFDIVHRITPLTPTAPSILAKRCRRAGVPFVIGPINGGVPWPKAFDSERRREREWLSYFRAAYKLIPGYRSTWRDASAIIAGSRFTMNDLPSEVRAKCHYMPENAIDPERFSGHSTASDHGPLRVCFVGRLVPYKGADMLLEAMIPMLRAGTAVLDIVGDGPMMPSLRSVVHEHGLAEVVNIHGWVEHRHVQGILQTAHVLGFPSIREFGGGVVLESMALGVVPLVVDYAGPGELVDDGCGIKVPLGDRAMIVSGLTDKVQLLCKDRSSLATLSKAAQEKVRKDFTWSAKAQFIQRIYGDTLKM